MSRNIGMFRFLHALILFIVDFALNPFKLVMVKGDTRFPSMVLIKINR